jgi:hypothetical protein
MVMVNVPDVMLWLENVNTPMFRFVSVVLYIITASNAPDDVKLVHCTDADGVQYAVVLVSPAELAFVTELPPVV